MKTDDGDGAVAAAYRPQAIIEQDGASTVYLGGTPEEIEAQASAIGGDPVDGWIWPETLPGPVRWSLRVPPAHVRAAVDRVRADYSYQAGLGVGEVRLSGPDAGVDLAEKDRSAVRSRSDPEPGPAARRAVDGLGNAGCTHQG